MPDFTQESKLSLRGKRSDMLSIARSVSPLTLEFPLLERELFGSGCIFLASLPDNNL